MLLFCSSRPSSMLPSIAEDGEVEKAVSSHGARVKTGGVVSRGSRGRVHGTSHTVTNSHCELDRDRHRNTENCPSRQPRGSKSRYSITYNNTYSTYLTVLYRAMQAVLLVLQQVRHREVVDIGLLCQESSSPRGYSKRRVSEPTGPQPAASNAGALIGPFRVEVLSGVNRRGKVLPREHRLTEHHPLSARV